MSDQRLITMSDFAAGQKPFSEVLEMLRPGDIGLVRSSHIFGKLIRFGQRLEDGEISPYNHAFIISVPKDTRLRNTHIDEEGRRLKRPRPAINPRQYYADGTTAESLWHICHGELKAYINKPIAIGRHINMNQFRFACGYREILDNIGQVYPAHRILLHGIDLLRAYLWRKLIKQQVAWRYSQFGLMDWPVCSELAGQFINAAGLKGGWEGGEKWRGLNPDHIWDAWCEHSIKLWMLVFVGVMTKG